MIAYSRALPAGNHEVLVEKVGEDGKREGFGVFFDCKHEAESQKVIH